MDMLPSDSEEEEEGPVRVQRGEDGMQYAYHDQLKACRRLKRSSSGGADDWHVQGDLIASKSGSVAPLLVDNVFRRAVCQGGGRAGFRSRRSLLIRRVWS